MSLRNETNATELLQCAKMLKQSPAGQGIFINPDLTPAEAQAAFEQRQRRRQMKVEKKHAVSDPHSTERLTTDASESAEMWSTLSATATVFAPNDVKGLPNVAVSCNQASHASQVPVNEEDSALHRHSDDSTAAAVSAVFLGPVI